jgi:hypothetical protein
MVTDPQVRELMKLIQSEETLALAAAVSTGFFSYQVKCRQS